MSISEKLKAARASAAGQVPDALMAAGAGAVSFGAGQIYPPAGWIALGIFLLAAGWMGAKGGQ